MLEALNFTAKTARARFAYQPARNGVPVGGIEGMLTQNLTGE